MVQVLMQLLLPADSAPPLLDQLQVYLSTVRSYHQQVQWVQLSRKHMLPQQTQATPMYARPELSWTPEEATGTRKLPSPYALAPVP